MEAKDYKQILLNVYKTQELTEADFLDTLNEFERLIKKEV